MFRSRFHDAFPRSFSHIGPQDVERGVSEYPPGDQIERLLCALLGLVLNRKKDVEYVTHTVLRNLRYKANVHLALHGLEASQSTSDRT